jgi:hypothetical protein
VSTNPSTSESLSAQLASVPELRRACQVMAELPGPISISTIASAAAARRAKLDALKS